MPAKGAAELLAPGSSVSPWREFLPEVTAEVLATGRRRKSLERRLRALPSELLTHFAQSLEEWWPLRPATHHALELLLFLPDGGKEAATLYHRVIRVGSDAASEVQLYGPEIATRHCELRMLDDRVRVVDLGSMQGTSLNGERLTPFEPADVEPGDRLEVGPFVLLVGEHKAQVVGCACHVDLREALYFPASAPFGKESGAGCELWARVATTEWSGYVGIPSTWLAYAYSALGYGAPDPTWVGNEVDRAITSFLLERVAGLFFERTGIAVTLTGLLTGRALAGQYQNECRDWEGARFGVSVGDRFFEVVAVWPSAQTPASIPARAPRWLEETPFEISVVAGDVLVAANDLSTLDRGDTLLPDRWTAGEGEGSVQLRLQGQTRPARLRRKGDSFFIEMTTVPWAPAREGGAMLAKNVEVPHRERGETGERASSAEAPESGKTPSGGQQEAEAVEATRSSPSSGEEGVATATETMQLPEELEVLLSFELERISVPLRDLSGWQEGSTVRLQRGPEDPVRIVLRQPGAERLLGFGRVIVVENKLGIQIETWLVEKER